MTAQVAETPAQAAETRSEAEMLVKEARELLAVGDMNAAREKAMAAQQLNATFPLFSDRPELVLQDIRDTENSNMIAQAPASAAGPPRPTYHGSQPGEATGPRTGLRSSRIVEGRQV
ncbi:MAG: hypothetical protein R3C02_21235 [Planctomycetaceae bacterium]